MRTAESESGRRVVVEAGAPPRDRRVASLASRWESGRGVVRTGRALERAHVTALTTRSRAFEYAVDVTLAA